MRAKYSSKFISEGAKIYYHRIHRSHQYRFAKRHGRHHCEQTAWHWRLTAITVCVWTQCWHIICAGCYGAVYLIGLWFCLFVCGGVGLLPRKLEIACIYPHQTGFVGKGSDHLQLIKFWLSCTPGKGVWGGTKVFGSALLQAARSVTVFASPLSAFFIVLLRFSVPVIDWKGLSSEMTYNMCCWGTLLNNNNNHHHEIIYSAPVIVWPRTSVHYIVNKATRSSADADNRLDAFSGQSRSTNILWYHSTCNI